MAKVTVLFGNEPQGEHNLDQSEVTIGRARDCDILVDNLGVSRHHCSIVQDGDGWKVVDKGSNNGTFLNGAQVSEQTLKHDDRIVLGKYSLVFDAHGYASGGDQGAKGGAGGGMGAEMTMFVDPEAIKQMQQKMKAEGGAAERYALALQQGGREALVNLTGGDVIVGKGGGADVPVKGLFVKPVQAKVVKSEAGWRVIAFGGLRGVKVNGRKVGESLLKPGDVIQVAATSMTFKKL